MVVYLGRILGNRIYKEMVLQARNSRQTRIVYVFALKRRFTPTTLQRYKCALNVTVYRAFPPQELSQRTKNLFYGNTYIFCKIIPGVTMFPFRMYFLKY